MTVESSISKTTYLGNGVTTQFPVNFEYSSPDTILVERMDAKGNITQIAENYRVESNDSGDTWVLYPLSGSPLPKGEKLTVYRRTPQTQILDLVYGGAFAPDTLEQDGFDRAVMMIQEVQEQIDRSVKVPLGSDLDPDELWRELLADADAAEQSAQAAAAAEAEARNNAALTAEIKAAALREVREEGDSQGRRLDQLAVGHILTFEREVERAHAEVEKAAAEADRAEAAVDRAGEIATLAQGVENLEATWTLAEDREAGAILELPIPYLVGRAALRLSWEGVELYHGPQYEEQGEKDSVSRSVILRCPLPAGARINAWAIASNVARGAQLAQEAAEKAAEQAVFSADVAEGWAEDAEVAAQAVNVSRTVAQNAAIEATEQADRADVAATDAERAARKAVAANCGKGIAVLQNMELLENAPDGFYFIDPELAIPATCVLPINTVLNVEDIVCDGFYFLGMEPHCPDPCPPQGDPDDTPGGSVEGSGDDSGGGNGGNTGSGTVVTPDMFTPCGGRKRMSL